MKRRRGLLSLTVEESEYFNDNQEKFELVACPINGKPCMNHLTVINASFKESGIYLRNKDYSRSIEALKGAFYITTNIQDSSCRKCNELFRSTISETLENIRFDLQKMTTGFFSAKRFHADYKLACVVTDELRNVG
ncbi:MAG: hypothetical protein WAO52_06895 [Prolixibacteraceae bacterium]